jgi:hypothetical protein
LGSGGINGRSSSRVITANRINSIERGGGGGLLRRMESIPLVGVIAGVAGIVGAEETSRLNLTPR